MCGGSKGETPYGQVETDPKRKARTAELMTQLKGAGYEERAAKVKSLAERGNQLNRSMHQNLAGIQQMIYGTPTDSSRSCSLLDIDSDSESENGRRDTAYLTDDGKEVIQREYKLINGHWALITSRKQLHEVDAYLLLQLREKRERKLATQRKDGKQIEREQTVSDSIENRGPKPSSSLSVDDIALYPEVILWRKVSTGISKKDTEKQKPSASSSSSLSSFRARAEQKGFRPIGEWDSDQEYELETQEHNLEYTDTTDHMVPVRQARKKAKFTNHGKSHMAESQEDLDIWQKIADEE
ncbi:hypothetical protein E0Z10_g6962 [Xylaria hypoxylon]|uniref:Uncharacterized protein n=1 Tax=Xylaria hypoxylon TaxID=37992 RepID=A0A4Z0YRK6_9PEZI|nr:hypothetical protein E0Z10_g6962 [Xylaria hypoxylon]